MDFPAIEAILKALSATHSTRLGIAEHCFGHGSSAAGHESLPLLGTGVARGSRLCDMSPPRLMTSGKGAFAW